MILTPFAAASTVTTFSDGSSEVVIEFKDGFNSVNNTDGGFYLGSDETITAATVNVSSQPMLHSTSNGYSGLQSFSWDSTTNNGATTFDNVSNFVFNKDTLQNSVQFNSESLVTDFELDNGQFDNTTNNFDDLGNALTWDYNKIDFKEIKRLSIDGTSGTVLVTDQNGDPLTYALMYNDASAVEEAKFVENLSSGHPILSSPSLSLIHI